MGLAKLMSFSRTGRPPFRDVYSCFGPKAAVSNSPKRTFGSPDNESRPLANVRLSVFPASVSPR